MVPFDLKAFLYLVKITQNSSLHFLKTKSKHGNDSSEKSF